MPAYAIRIAGVLCPVCTTAFSPEEILWSWSGGSEEKDYGSPLAADSRGNALVAGYTFGAGWNKTGSATRDFIATSLNGTTGQQLWTYQGSFPREDRVYDACIDSDDNLVIVGTTTQSSDLGSDFAAVKVNGTSGSQMWEYQEALGTSVAAKLQAAAADLQGDFFFAGEIFEYESDSSNGVADCVAMKLDGQDGNQTWFWRAGDGSIARTCSGIGADSYGDAIVAGIVYEDLSEIRNQAGLAYKLNGTSGTKLWRWGGNMTYSANDDGIHSSVVEFTAVVVDQSDDVLLVGRTKRLLSATLNAYRLDFAAIKLSGSTGEELWHWEDGSSSDDVMYEAAVDEDGNFVIAGRTDGEWVQGADNASDTALVYLDGSSGEELWRWQGGGDFNFCCANAVEVSPSGELLVGGLTYVYAADSDDDDPEDVDLAVFKMENPIASEDAESPGSASDSSDTHTPARPAIILTVALALFSSLLVLHGNFGFKMTSRCQP